MSAFSRFRAQMNDSAAEKPQWKHQHSRRSLQPKASKDAGGLRWSCGNPKMRKFLVKKFTQMTTLHGVHYIRTRQHKATPMKIFYGITFCFCFLMAINSIRVLLVEALGKESTFINRINKDMKAGKLEDPTYFPKYPAVTVCRKPPFRTDFNSSYRELVEYMFLALGYPFVSFTPKEIAMLIELAKHANDTAKLGSEALAFGRRLSELQREFERMKTDIRFNLTQFLIDHSIQCDEFFFNCFAAVQHINCCAIFRPIWTSMGMCYAMRNSRDLMEIFDKSVMETPFVVDLQSPVHPGKEVQEGFNLFLTDPQDELLSLMDTEGQKIIPGVTSTISVQLVKTQRTALHVSWHGFSSTCPTWPWDSNRERFTRKMCWSFIRNQHLKNFCKCRSVVHPGTSGERVCEPFDMYHCITSKSLRMTSSHPLRGCPEPCIVYSYQSAVSFMGLGIKNISRVEILYNWRQYVHLEYRQTTFSRLFSQIGGCLGLYLGASVITMTEILTFVCSWLFYRICPCQKKAKAEGSF